MKRTISILVGLFVAYTSFAQGPLEPPGAPAPVMRSLDQIEPRTPISTLPFTISQPGSYYVTGPLSSDGHGIVVQSSHATIDLMGFTISGSNDTNFHGIYAHGGPGISADNVHVRNGGVKFFGNGIVFENVDGGSIRYITVVKNERFGVHVTSMSGPTMMSQNISIEHCHILNNGLRGLQVGGETTGRGMVIRNNVVRGNDHIGIFFGSIRDSIVTDNYIGPQLGSASTIGISAIHFTASLLARNLVAGNTNNYVFSGTGTPVRGGIITKSDGILDNTGVEAHPWANFGW